jgi:LuxR family maltose regulon positive regulatory protein
VAADDVQLPRGVRPPVFSRTKFLAPPPRPNAVERHALRDRLVAAAPLPLTLVVGSPGSGKSSLLADWFRATDDGSNAWLAADRGDDDPTRFWQGFIRAIQQVDPTFGVEAADIITLDGVVGSDVLESLLADDAACGERINVVIDDFHLVSLQAADQLFHLLDRGLSNVRLLIGSRSDPVGVHRLRVREAVHEVREADLRLDPHETEQLLGRLGVEPGSIGVAALHHRTEGWAAGVQLAALALRSADDPSARLRELTGTAQTIAGYLTAEVLSTQSAPLQRFLEDTCVVDELDAALAAALVPDDPDEPDEPRITLSDVEHANLMLSRVDSAGTVFRYHQLFGEMLRHRLEVGDPERFRRQHHRAAQHFLGIGDTNAAVRHLWRAGHGDEAARLLRTRMLDVLSATDAPAPIEPHAIPSADAVAASPIDAVGYAVGLMMNGHAPVAARLLRSAESAAIAAGLPPDELLQVWAARLTAELLVGETAEAVHCARSVCALADEGGLAPDAWNSVSFHFGARAAVWERDFELAEALLAMAERSSDARLERVDVAGVRAFLHHERGELDLAVAAADRATTAAHALGVAGNGADVAARAVRGAARLDRGDLDDAERDFRFVLDGRRIERVPSFVLATVGLGRVHRARGDFDAALRLHESAKSRLSTVSPGPTLRTTLVLGKVAVRLALGDLDRAGELLDTAADGFRTRLLRGWLQTLSRRTDGLDELLADLAASSRSPRDELEVALLRLRMALDLDLPGADALADVVLDLSEPAGFLLPIAESGTGPLLAVVGAARSRPRTAYVERLSATRPVPRPAEQARPVHTADELSNRELIVLRYMATSMSNQEIADALFLSVNTVKTHIKHVLRKLGATSRTEATQRAQELRYL